MWISCEKNWISQKKRKEALKIPFGCTHFIHTLSSLLPQDFEIKNQDKLRFFLRLQTYEHINGP